MLLIEGYISNFTCARYYFLYVEFSDFYVNKSLAGQTIQVVTYINIFGNVLRQYYIQLLLKIKNNVEGVDFVVSLLTYTKITNVHETNTTWITIVSVGLK
jgi:hypothetical protein